MLEQGGFRMPATETVLIQSKRLTFGNPAFAATVFRVESMLARRNDVTNIVSPIRTPKAGVLAPDGHSALVQFDIVGKAADAKNKVAPILAAVRAVHTPPGVTVDEFGKGSADYETNKRFAQDLTRAEYTSLPLTLAILVVAFGALVAAGLPVVLAFSAVLVATGLNTLVSHLVPTMAQMLATVILMIGMAVGIDYSLFYLQREREERRRGRDQHSALLRAAATSGQAVLISGGTVLIAMAGMFFAGNAVFTTMALGTMIVVFAAMVGSLTVLPALLHRLGDTVDRGRIPLIRRRSGEPRVWGAVVGGVLKHPVVAVVLAGGGLLLLATPALSMHTKLPSYTDMPRDMAIVQTLQRVQAAFPGSQTPAVLVVKGDVTSPAYSRAYAEFRRRARSTGELFPPFHVTINGDKTVARVEFSVAGNGDNAASMHALKTLRDKVIPPIAAKLPDAQYAVTGVTAGTYDFNQQMKQRLPFVFLFVLGLAFVLLLLTFRSIVIPLKAVLLNLLSVAAAYGIIVAVFQHTWAEGILGFTSNNSIPSWLPLFLFVVLFGLSMDYHVFILSRVKELHDDGESTEDAVRHAIMRTAGTVTSAALIMVAVFGLFATLSILSVKQMGFGLAVAVLIDATIVRAVLLPAAMKLLGEWNWYLPRWLEWLPSLSPEREADEPVGRAPSVPTA